MSCELLTGTSESTEVQTRDDTGIARGDEETQ